jgi:hypothetical protein
MNDQTLLERGMKMFGDQTVLGRSLEIFAFLYGRNTTSSVLVISFVM